MSGVPGKLRPVKRIAYSRHAARAAALLFLVPLGCAFLGRVLGGESGTAIGGGIGISIGLLLAFRVLRRHRRGESWMASARTAGLKAIYSGHAPAIGLEGFRWTENLVGGTDDGIRLLVGDRLGWYAGYHADAVIGTWDTNRLQTADPVPEETFFALWIPGVRHGDFQLGRRKSLRGANRTTAPGEPDLSALHAWIREHPEWRLEGRDDLVVGTRPNHVASPEELGDYVRLARDLGRTLRPAP